MSNAQAATLLSDNRVAANDLIAGVYEGGFKTWEGGLDLAQFLAAQLAQQRQAGALPELGPATCVMELVRRSCCCCYFARRCLGACLLSMLDPPAATWNRLLPLCTCHCRVAEVGCQGWWHCGQELRCTSRRAAVAC